MTMCCLVLSVRKYHLMLLVLLMCGVAKTAAQAPGVTENQIKIGACSALDGPARQLGLQSVLGATAYFSYVNDHGGVNGRKLSLVSFDDGYETARTASCFALLKRENVFAGGFFVGTSNAAKYLPMAQAEHMPLVGLITGAQFLYEPVKHEVFNLRASYADETRVQVESLWNAGIRKIGVIYQADGFGNEVLNGVKSALAKHHATIVAAGSFTRNTLEVDRGIAEVRAAHPEAVILGAVYAPAAKIVIDAHEQGWRPLFVLPSPVGTEAFIGAAGKDAEGTVITQIVPTYDHADLPAVKLYRECLSKYMSSTQPTFFSLEGFVNAMVIVEGLKRAGQNPTREKFITAIESLNDFDIGLGTDARLKFSPQSHKGLNYVYSTVVRGGRAELFSDWVTLLARK